MAKNESTGSKVTKIASSVLRNPTASATAKSLAGAALAQANTTKQSTPATARTAAKALNDGRSSATTQKLAGSVLTQKTKK